MSIKELESSIWKVHTAEPEKESLLRSELGVSKIIATALIARGFSDPSTAEKFLHPSLNDLHSPTLLPDYRKAVDTILNAHALKKKFYIHGDYDVDGVTSAALFTRFLRKIGCEVLPHVPHRMREGYGIHLDAVEHARSNGAQLFLTCDCGVSAHEQVLAAREGGMQVVITDHHLVSETLPEAEAIVNPHRSGSEYPWPELSGVGVAFKLCAGITEEIGHKKEDYYRAYLDLAVLGTVADVMPLQGENRIITKFGLLELVRTKKKGIQALINVAELSDKRALTARNIGFQLGPRINAVGRIDDAAHALDLLLTDDPQEATLLARLLDHHNEHRRAEQNRIFEEATEAVLARGEIGNHAIVVANAGWHPGVIGIVAGKLVERFRRPSFVVSIDEQGLARGSARSVPGFNLAGAIEATRQFLLSGGGHEMAAGFTLDSSKLDDFTPALLEYSMKHLRPEDCLPRFFIDAIIEGADATEQAIGELSGLEPFGQANPEPMFATLGARITSLTPTRNPDHARLNIQAADGTKHQAMAFGIGRALDEFRSDQPIDLAFTLEQSEWNGASQFRWIIRDYRPGAV